MAVGMREQQLLCNRAHSGPKRNKPALKRNKQAQERNKAAPKSNKLVEQLRLREQEMAR